MAIDINGTHLQGYITATYAELKKAFGVPWSGDGYRVDAEWAIEEGGIVATVYNYKDGINYNGRRRGTPKTKITEWHIGGYGPAAVGLVYRKLGREGDKRMAATPERVSVF